MNKEGQTEDEDELPSTVPQVPAVPEKEGQSKEDEDQIEDEQQD